MRHLIDKSRSFQFFFNSGRNTAKTIGGDQCDESCVYIAFILQLTNVVRSPCHFNFYRSKGAVTPVQCLGAVSVYLAEVVRIAKH